MARGGGVIFVSIVKPCTGGIYVEGTLTQHLLEVDATAQAQVDLTVRRLRKQYPAPDRGVDFLAYVGHLNNLTTMAEEIVLHDLIYA